MMVSRTIDTGEQTIARRYVVDATTRVGESAAAVVVQLEALRRSLDAEGTANVELIDELDELDSAARQALRLARSLNATARAAG